MKEDVPGSDGKAARAGSLHRDVTLAEVARLAGVSTSTVSRVVRNPDMVHPATVDRVREAMEQAGFSAQRAAGGRKGAVLVPVSLPNISDPFFALVLKGIVDAASLADAIVCYVDADYSESIQLAGVGRLARTAGVGAIVTPVNSEPDFCRRLEEAASPIVYVDRSPLDRPAHRVVGDDLDGAYQATKYLLSLGHRRILYVGGDTNISSEQNRLAGYRRAVGEAGLPVDSSLVHEHSFDEKRLLADGAEDYLLHSKFTALVAASDNLASAVAGILLTGGLRVPEDVSIVGYGDMPYSHHTGLTTVSSPAYEMGKNALMLYLALLEGKVPEPKEIVLRPSMMLRSSCAPPRP